MSEDNVMPDELEISLADRQRKKDLVAPALELIEQILIKHDEALLEEIQSKHALLSALVEAAKNIRAKPHHTAADMIRLDQALSDIQVEKT